MDNFDSMQNSDDSYIVAKNISHIYGGEKLALDNINLEINPGLFGLLGANGAGKSTLMRIICTLLEPTSGQITIGGYDVVKDRHEVRKLLGYLPQEFGAWRLHTVEEVLSTLAALSGIRDKKTRIRRVDEVLGMVGLSEVTKRKVKNLSGGMLRRLGVAQALVHDPKVLVLDEPTVGLDPEERLRFRQLIAELGRDRVILLSTHIVADFGSSCSDMVLIYEGQVQFRGSPTELVDKARGKVLELTLSHSAAQEVELSNEFEIVTRLSQNGKSVLRGVAKNGVQFEGACNAQDITLEEAYLAFTMN